LPGFDLITAFIVYYTSTTYYWAWAHEWAETSYPSQLRPIDIVDALELPLSLWAVDRA
jgi:hypothetical protein